MSYDEIKNKQLQLQWQWLKIFQVCGGAQGEGEDRHASEVAHGRQLVWVVSHKTRRNWPDFKGRSGMCPCEMFYVWAANLERWNCIKNDSWLV